MEDCFHLLAATNKKRKKESIGRSLKEEKKTKTDRFFFLFY